MYRCEHRQIELVHSRVGLIGNPQKAKRSVYRKLHPPAPSDDFPDFAEQWLWYEIEIAHHFLCIECDYGEFQRCMESLSRNVGQGASALTLHFLPMRNL